MGGVALIFVCQVHFSYVLYLFYKQEPKTEETNNDFELPNASMPTIEHATESYEENN